MLAALSEALTAIRAEIRFALTPLPQVINGLAQNGPADLRAVFGSLQDAWTPQTTFRSVWNLLISKVAEAGLKDDDVLPLSALGASLGRFDAETQTVSLDAAITHIGERRILAEQTARDKFKVYGALGTAAGLGLVILLW